MPAHKCICICPGIVVYRRGIECEALQTAADLMQSPVKRQTKKKIRMNLFFFFFFFFIFLTPLFLLVTSFFLPVKNVENVIASHQSLPLSLAPVLLRCTEGRISLPLRKKPERSARIWCYRTGSLAGYIRGTYCTQFLGWTRIPFSCHTPDACSSLVV